MEWQQTIDAAGLTFEIAIEVSTAVALTVQLEPLAALAETYLIRVVAQADSPDTQFRIARLNISWALPAADMHGLYFGGNPTYELSHLPFWWKERQVAAYSGLPYMALLHRAGANRAAFGLVDQLSETRLVANLSELTRCYHMQMQKPALEGQAITAQGRYEEVLFVSRAGLPWPEVLRAYADSVVACAALSAMPVPESAYDPVFCTWTAIHHDVSHDWIMRNARAAADLGFRTWITDDGWFIEKGAFANYSRAGDWRPSEKKFPDFKAHVQAVQALGFRYVLWVAPFMVGEDSQAAKEYAHLLLPLDERLRFSNLAPWRAESGEIILRLLQRLVQDYRLDGLKIDFLDSLRHKPELPQNGTTLGSAYDDILKQAVDCLLAIQPDLLVEFRNTYANLASRSYANIYRSSDVPINPGLNRWQAVMLRLLVPDRAVHLDPALWHPTDTDENVAAHMINCIASVPMVSIELDQYPQSHLDIVRHWIGFYNAHRDTIIHGDFCPELHLGHVPAIYFRGEAETIVGLYDDVPVTLAADGGSIWLLNASTRNQIYLQDSSLQGARRVLTRDKYGRLASESRLDFPLTQLQVEVGGSIEIKSPDQS